MKVNRNSTKGILIGLIFFTSSTGFLQAQVTIGLGEAPARTGLLQIKDQTADTNNITAISGGFILPRVALVDLQSLEPFVNTSDEKYEEEKRESIGLLVYNMSKATPFIPGLYCWDGEKWNILRTSIDPSTNGNNNGNSGDNNNVTDSTEMVIPSSITDPAGLKFSNSHIVPNNKYIDIPVIKAFAVWKQLLNVDIDMAGEITAELLWEDTRTLVKNISIIDKEKGAFSKIRVTTNNTNLQGNALVAVKINNVVRWSWHIWVTGYNPSSADNQNIFNGLTFMDRNLGALNTLPGNTGSLGLLYQWGRKDPFSGASAIDSNDEKYLYNPSGENISISKSSVNSERNLPNSIINPTTFYYNTTGNLDWYSNNSSVKNDFLWNNTDNTKSPYDPCPKGWRVPLSGAGTASVWYGMGGSTPAFDKGRGLNIQQAGYYPATGYRDSASGTLTNVGTDGYVWAATTYYSTAYRLWFKSYYTQTDEKDYRAKGNSVRCVKE